MAEINPVNTGSTVSTQTEQTGASTGEPTYSFDTPIGNMTQFREKFPELYKMTMEGLVTNMVNQMKSREDQRKERKKEYDRWAEGK